LVFEFLLITIIIFGTAFWYFSLLCIWRPKRRPPSAVCSLRGNKQTLGFLNLQFIFRTACGAATLEA